jgi:hypothetical protein
VKSAVVIVDEIDARVAGSGWVPISTTPITIDLLALDHQSFTSLGLTTLPKGHVRKLRLKLDQVGDYVVLTDGTKKPLEVPDNGIVEIEGDLDLAPCAAGVIIVDFDPKLKIEDEHARREYELRPEARIRTAETAGSCSAGGGGGSDGGADGGGNNNSCNGIVCAMGETCSNGMCVPDCSSIVCMAGQTCTNGVCH